MERKGKKQDEETATALGHVHWAARPQAALGSALVATPTYGLSIVRQKQQPPLPPLLWRRLL
jgi:hypothetical protein